MSTEKIKSLGAFTRKYEHNYRTGNVPNADKSRTHLNEEIIKLPEGQTYTDAFKRKMLEINHTPRSNAVLGVELVMNYNPLEVPADFDIDKWKEANVKWLKENFPEDCILSVVMHRDEGPDNGKAAHIHAIVLPIYEGKLNCKHYLSGRAKMIQLQDSYGKAMKPLGLERGMRGSVAEHEKIRQFYDTLNKTIGEKVPEPEEDEEIEHYYNRVQKFYEDSNLKNLKKIKDLERQITELKTALKMAKFEANMEAIENKKVAKKLREEAEKEKVELKKREEVLKEKESEYREAQAKTRNFNTLMNGLKNHPDKEFVDSLGQDIKNLIEWEQEYEKSLDNEDREMVDTELFEKIK